MVQARFGIVASTTRDTMMNIAKRFSIVCLFTALTGMGLVSLIQQASSPAYSLKIETALPCIYDAPLRCNAPVGQ